MIARSIRKTQFRRVFVCLIAGLLVIFGTGCRSMIELAKMEQAARLEPKPMELSSFYSEEEGFHYPGFNWGDGFSEFQRVTDFSVTDMEGYTELETVYTASELRLLILERVNDEASIGCRDKDEVAFVSINFSKDSDPDTFPAFCEQIEKKLTELFGASAETIAHNEEVDGKLYNFRTEVWQKTVGGKITEFQFGTATLPGSATPNFLSIGVNWRSFEGASE